ncbi:MAG TPA: hypothetical protein VJ440_13925, partial [Candidatus Brocadiaceae bacterium]|nr:hypothetical protein [Candidatus Brocadiaceae bacterium]
PCLIFDFGLIHIHYLNTYGLQAGVRDGRYVYGCRSAFVLTPAFRLGCVMTTEWALALTVMGGRHGIR